MIEPVLAATSTLATYAEALLTAAQRTTSSHAPLLVRVGGRHVAMHFDGPATTGALLPAWRSLLGTEGAVADADLYVRTQSSCGQPPAMPGERDMPLRVARSTSMSGDGIELERRGDTGAVALWDGSARRGVWWGRSAEALTTADRVSPLGPLLRWALRSLEVPVVRAGVVASQRGGLLVVTPRAGGCSSTVLAARRLGMAAIADEHVAVDPATRTAYPVTGFATVDEATLRRMPELVGRLAQLPRTPDGKQALLLDERPLRAASGTPLRGIVVPRLGEPDVSPRRLDAADAEAALQTATRPAAGPTVGADSPWPEALRALPVFEFGLGSSPDEAADRLATVFRSLD